MGCSHASESVGQDRSHVAETPRALCSDSGVFDVAVAQRMRDELGQRTLSRERVLEVTKALEHGVLQCSGSLEPPNVEMVGALYVSLGNQFLSEKDYSRAKGVFEAADRYYSGFAFPSLMWLEALRGVARSDVRLGDLQAADAVASRQTELARSWVDGQRFVRDILVDALRFEAEVSNAEKQSAKASALMSEAERLESPK